MKKVSVTDKYTYDGIEMTEREIQMYKEGQKSNATKIDKAMCFLWGCLVMNIVFYIIHLTTK